MLQLVAMYSLENIRRVIEVVITGLTRKQKVYLELPCEEILDFSRIFGVCIIS